jgi:hypothetical protein
MGEEGMNFFTQLKTVFINDARTGERSMSRSTDQAALAATSNPTTLFPLETP